MADNSYTENREIIRALIEMSFPEHLDFLTQDEVLEKIVNYYLNESNFDADAVDNYIRGLLPNDGQDSSGVFNPDEADEQPIDKKPKRTRGKSAKHTLNKIIAEEARQLQATNWGQCATIISKRAAIVGYLVPTPEHFDIGKTTSVDKASGRAVTTVGLRYVAAGAVKGIIVAAPSYALEEVRKCSLDPSADPDSCDVARANQENQPYVVELQAADYFTNTFLTSESAGSIREDEHIWQPTVINRYMPASRETVVTVYDTLADVEEKAKANDDIIAGKNAVFAQSVYRKEAGSSIQTPYVRMKHSLRTQLKAPGNYVAARTYDTIEIRDSYPPEEAEQLNQLYLSRLLRTKYKGTMVLETLSDDDTTLTISIDPDTNKKTIAGSRFFTTNPAESIMTKPIPHWFNKDSQGKPELVDPIGKQLIKRAFRLTKAGDPSPYIVYKNMSETQNAEGTAYVPDFSPNGEYAKIGDACRSYGVTLEVSELLKFFHAQHVIRDKSSPTNRSTTRTQRPIGVAAFGLNRTRSSSAIRAAAEALQQ